MYVFVRKSVQLCMCLVIRVRKIKTLVENYVCMSVFVYICVCTDGSQWGYISMYMCSCMCIYSCVCVYFSCEL